METSYSISVWHKDGMTSDGKTHVYQNGKLKNTRGEFEHIALVIDGEQHMPAHVTTFNRVLSKKEIEAIENTGEPIEYPFNDQRAL